jgi:hypothetical protein
VVVVLVGLLAAWSVRSAAGHYEHGLEALADERYSAAIQEFNAARIIVFPYRDAKALAAEAAAALNLSMRRESLLETRIENAVRDYVTLADMSLQESDGAERAERALADARDLVPRGQLSADPFTLVLLQALSRRLDDLCRQALADGNWDMAGAYAGALLAITPRDAPGERLARRARLGERLQDRLGDARAAADRGEWRRALRLARAVLDEWPGFPGAASLVGDAKRALAPKPAPAPSPSEGPAAPAPQTTPTAPTTPTPPPP